jgi:cation/acetate symporter
MLADEVARIGELEQQFGFVKTQKPSLAMVPKGLAGITKAHSAVNATPWAFISLALSDDDGNSFIASRDDEIFHYSKCKSS